MNEIDHAVRETSSQAGTSVIDFVDIHKRFGSVSVLSGLDLSVKRGEVFGFLGKNGAGKSTAIRILMGISRPNAGQIRLFGLPVKPNRTALRRRIGYVAQEQNFYAWMTPHTLARFLRGFYPTWNHNDYVRLAETLELPLHRKIGTFSGGMKAKLGLAVALSIDPELLVLDEPTAGMDPVARREFLQLVREQSENHGTSIFFSTHLVDEIESVADRIAIVDQGRTVYAGSLPQLSNSIGAWSIAASDPGAEGLPGDFAVVARRTLSDTVQQGRRVLILQFDHALPVIERLEPGWQQQLMSLEDMFVAVVAPRQRPGG